MSAEGQSGWVGWRLHFVPMTRVLTQTVVLWTAGLMACAGPVPSTSDLEPTDPTGAGETAETGTPPVITDDPRVVAGGVQLCDDPAARQVQAFERTVYGEGWPNTPEHGTPAWELKDGGRGVAVGDFSGDGVPDILVPRDRFPSQLLLGGGDGSFTEAPAPDSVARNLNGASVADFDSDGDLDAFGFGLVGTAVMFVNQGDGTFDVQSRAEWDTGDSGYGCGSAGAWADWDRDGDLDLFYGRLGGSNPTTGEVFTCDSQLLVNRGDGTFDARPELLSPEVQGIRVMAAGWFDFDGDGWLDVYTVSDAPPMANYLLFNDGGAGFTQPLNTGLEIVVAGMGFGAGDLNGDELPDVMVTAIGGIPTLVSAATAGIWIDSTNAFGLYPEVGAGQEVAWGGELVDLDNDGFLDVVETYGDFFGSASAREQADAIHRNLGDNTFESVGEAWGFADPEVNRGFVVTDLDGDGWLDIVKRELGGVVFVHRAACGDAGWLSVRLHDDQHPNHHAVGAKVVVSAGGQRWSRRLTAGSTSYESGGPPVVHFGLGDLDVVDAIEVTWPTGEVVQYPGTDTRQNLDIWRQAPMSR